MRERKDCGCGCGNGVMMYDGGRAERDGTVGGKNREVMRIAED